MTKRTYSEVADLLASAGVPARGCPSPNVTLSSSQRTMLAQRLAVTFKRDNARFDTARFLLACDVSASMADVVDGVAARRAA